MDADKDGLLSASDLVAAFGAHGKSIGSGDAQVNKSDYLYCLYCNCIIIVSLYHVTMVSLIQDDMISPYSAKWAALSY